MTPQVLLIVGATGLLLDVLVQSPPSPDIFQLALGLEL